MTIFARTRRNAQIHGTHVWERLGAILVFSSLLCVFGSALMAQNTDAALSANRSAADGSSELSEAPTAELRRNRPPRPTGEQVDCRFPSDFLTLSIPSSETAPENAPSAQYPAVVKKAESEKDRTFVLAAVVAIGFFLAFAWSDYRRRAWLANVLAANRQILSGEAPSGGMDFSSSAVPLWAGDGGTFAETSAFGSGSIGGSDAANHYSPAEKI